MNRPPCRTRITVVFPAFSLLIFVLCSLAFSYENKTTHPHIQEFSLPKTVDLCGEKIPLENPRVWEMLDREFTIMVWDRAQVLMWLKRAGRYFPYIERALERAGMYGDLKYLAVAESSLLPHIRSGKGAIGLWQFMTLTARRNGLRRDRMMDERRQFERATDAALKYLKHLNSIFGSWTLALAAYNLGEAKLKREIKTQKVEDYYRLNLPLETERFIFRIAAIKIIMEHPERYGYHLSPESIYRPIECDIISVNVPRSLHIMDVAMEVKTDYKIIKELNPHVIGSYLPSGRYTLKVPAGMGTRTRTVLKKLGTTPPHHVKKGSGGMYVVQSGDTLSHIAKRTGIPVESLKRLNGINGSLIVVGQRLQLK